VAQGADPRVSKGGVSVSPHPEVERTTNARTPQHQQSILRAVFSWPFENGPACRVTTMPAVSLLSHNLGTSCRGLTMYIVSCLFLSVANTVPAHHSAFANRSTKCQTGAPYSILRGEVDGLRHVFAQVPLHPAPRYDHVTFLMFTAPSAILYLEGAYRVPDRACTVVRHGTVENQQEVGGLMQHVRRYKRTQIALYIF
jgi:hypothetical protein